MMRRICLLILLPAIFCAGKSRSGVQSPVTADLLADFIENIGYSTERTTVRTTQGERAERISVNISGENLEFELRTEFIPELELTIIYVPDYMELEFGGAETLPMLAYLMDQNRELLFGHLDWNMDTGELRLVFTLPTDDGISESTFQTYFNTAATLADRKIIDLRETMDSFQN